MSEQERFGREVEEDHDLLTFNESAARIRQDIEQARATLDDATDAALRAQTERRLAQLLESQALVESQAAQNAQGRRFVDYRPPAHKRP